MQIRLVSTSKKRFLPLLLLADEQESMIDRYLERGDLYVMYDKLFTEPVAVAVVTDEGKGIRELKNLAVAPHWQRKGYGRQMVEYLCQRYQNVCHTPNNREFEAMFQWAKKRLIQKTALKNHCIRYIH